MTRKLFIALDCEGKKVHVDRITEKQEGYRCPYCKKEVVAKLGEEKIWHFAHKEKICEYLNIRSADNLSDAKLDFSGESMKTTDEIDIGSGSRDFLCTVCKKRFNKESGIRWQGPEFICRECFRNM